MVNRTQLKLNPSPTQFPELNAVLHDLTTRSAAILGDNFVGAYLQGSFALGDADLHSDCDFLIPVQQAVTASQEAALRALHDELPTRAQHWAHHIEGSYPVRDELRTLNGLGKPWLYIDHGWRIMQQSTHCNTEVVRWTLREHGVTLTGPEPRTLVDPVSPAVLRARMRDYAATFLPDLLTWVSLDIAWAQRYAVTTLCRIAYTFDEGRICSKRAALLWAADHLDPQWSTLFVQVLDDRSLGWDPDQAPRPGSVEQTRALGEHVRRRTAGG